MQSTGPGRLITWTVNQFMHPSPSFLDEHPSLLSQPVHTTEISVSFIIIYLFSQLLVEKLLMCPIWIDILIH